MYVFESPGKFEVISTQFKPKLFVLNILDCVPAYIVLELDGAISKVLKVGPPGKFEILD